MVGNGSAFFSSFGFICRPFSYEFFPPKIPGAQGLSFCVLCKVMDRDWKTKDLLTKSLVTFFQQKPSLKAAFGKLDKFMLNAVRIMEANIAKSNGAASLDVAEFPRLSDIEHGYYQPLQELRDSLNCVTDVADWKPSMQVIIYQAREVFLNVQRSVQLLRSLSIPQSLPSSVARKELSLAQLLVCSSS